MTDQSPHPHSEHDFDAPDPDDARLQRHTAGAFDIRNFIGSLIGIYGVILTAMGLFGDPAYDKTGGLNANLWAGLAMLAVGVGFMTWARLRPIVVPELVEPAPVDPTRPGPSRPPGAH